MLLVKSRELKSLGSKNSYKTWVWLIFYPLFLLPREAFAEPNSLSNPTSILSIFLSLLLVIGIVFALAYLMRRFNVTSSGSGQLKVVASMAAGTREKIIVLEVAGEQHLIGVTSNQINHLTKLDTQINNTPSTSPSSSFKDKLTEALAGKIQSGLKGNQANTQENSTGKSKDYD